MRMPGIEVDEALIANGIYERGAALYSWHFGGFEIPLMILSYLGALKTWIYNGIFAVWKPSPLSLRLPAMLAGAVAIWLFFVFLDRVAGRRAAWIGAVLLATDTSFVLGEAIDFGPVALHHLLKLSALVLLLRYHARRRAIDLAFAFCLLGLGIWDKAIFVWALSGISIAAIAVFPRQIASHLRPRTIAIATLSFALGSLPLIAYNVTKPLDTFRSNARLSAADSVVKIYLLSRTIDGSAMFGFFTADQPGPRPQPVGAFEQRAAIRVSEEFGSPRHNLTEFALLAAILSIPLLWSTPARQPVLFALIAMVVTWVQMFLTSRAGGAAHHVLLLWPLHLFLLAIVIDSLAKRFERVSRIACIATVSVLVAANLLVTNQYYVDSLHFGSSVRWSDAFPALIRTLEGTNAGHVYVADWGILETVNLMTEGSVPVVALDRDSTVPALFAGANDIFVSHTQPFLQVPEINAQLEIIGRATGYQKQSIATIYDRNGRGIFELFRYRHAGA
jgi:4-amino-4-deoxy-L-arabinose transferase-like glycosyltransferase